MENPKRGRTALRVRRSGYEPSDTETEWQETRWRGDDEKNGDEEFEEPNVGFDQERNISPLKLNHRRVTAKFDHELPSPVKLTSKVSPVRRRHSKSPYKLQRDDGNVLLPLPPGRRNISPLLSRPGSDMRKNVSPFSKVEHRKHASPYKPMREHHDELSSLNRKQTHRQVNDNASRLTDKLNHNPRSASAPRPRPRDKDQQVKYDNGDLKRHGRTPSPLSRNISVNERDATHKNTPSVGEINGIMANAKISRGLVGNDAIMESTDSISPGDIFFSRDYGPLPMQNIIFPKNGSYENSLIPKPNRVTVKSRNSHQQSNTNTLRSSSSNLLTRTSTVTSSVVSRQSSNLSDASNGSTRRFVENRRKNQTEAWFSCISKGSCRTSKKSPERERAFDEASFIEKAFVVERLRDFWADKYQPASLNGFSFHKQEAQLLKQLVSVFLYSFLL